MKVKFVHKGDLTDYKSETDGADILLFGFDCLGEVSYEKELKGESERFERAAKLSQKEGSVVVCGCITNTRGHKRKSALVAENGRILGVSDMLNGIDGEYSCGAELRIYPTQAGKMGVLVAEDLYFPDTITALALCGSDFIVCPFGRGEKELTGALLRAGAFYSGVPIFLSGKGYCMAASPDGELAFSSPHNPVSFEFHHGKEYHLVERRRRGCLPVDG